MVCLHGRVGARYLFSNKITLENVREVAKFKDTCECQPEVTMSLRDLTVSSSILSSWAAKCDIDRLLSR